MENFKVKLDKSFFETYTEDTGVTNTLAMVDNVDSVKDSFAISLGSSTINLDGKRICKNFSEKFFSVLYKLCATQTKFISCDRIMTEEKTIYSIYILRNSVTEGLFTIFTKLGIAVSNLSILYNAADGEIYLNQNLIYTAIKNLNETQHTQIVLYMVTLCETLINADTFLNVRMYEKEKHWIVDKVNKKLYIENSVVQNNIINCLEEIDWNKEYTIIKGTPELSNILQVDVGNPTNSAITTLCNLEELGFNYAFLKNNENVYILLYTNTMCILVGVGISTTHMYNLDINTPIDPIVNTVVAAFWCTKPFLTYSIYNLDTEIFEKNSTIHTYDTLQETDFEMSKLTEYMNCLKKLGLSEECDVKKISKVLGFKVKAFKGITLESAKEEYKDDEYAQELYKQVQPYYDEFDLDTLESCLKGFRKENGIYAMMFIGETGTGKSTAAKVIPYKCGFPFICVNFSVNLEESDLIGTMIPNTSKEKPEDPEFIWQDGLLTKAIRNGYTFIAEEINFARPGVLSKLNSLLDENRQIDLPTGECIKAHKNFRIIATCNIAYEGTNRFNKALINRFELIHVFKELDRNEMIKVIMDRTGYKDIDKIVSVYNVYEAIKKYSTEQQCDAKVSLRQMLTIFSKGTFYKRAYEAVVDILINGAFIEDEVAKDYFIDSVLSNFDLNFKI